MKKIFPLLTALSMLFINCSKDDTSTDRNVVIESINVQNGIVGDEVIILGSNFDANTNYTIKFGGISSIVNFVNSTSLKTNIPNGALSGTITIEYDGKLITVANNFQVLPTFYLFKRNYEAGEVRNFIKYNLTNSAETIITPISSTEYFNNFSTNGGDISSVYSPQTNEIIALVDFNTLLKINVSSGVITKNILSTNDYDQYKGLTITNNGELFLFKRNYQAGEVRNFIKYNLTNSTETIITPISSTEYFNNFSTNGGDISSVYSPQTNEVIALVDFNTLLKINVSSGVITKNILSTNDYDQYKGLTITNNGELFLFKRNYQAGEVRNFIKYNLTNSTETIITPISSTEYFNNFSTNGGDISSVYSPQTNEVIALVDFNTLLKINVSSGVITKNILSTNDYDQYKGLKLN